MTDADMSLEQVKGLADLVGVPIDAEDLPEVANRFASLIRELDRLRDMDLEGVEPVTIFPDTDGG
jgi:Asp-tRNA(Asn)/Glu-tRNA(Gln) amidotransferase C subunit